MNHIDRYPFGLKLIILFFGADSLEKLYLVLQKLQAFWLPSGDPAMALEEILPFGIICLFDLLLALQLIMLMRTGRIWASIFLGANIGLSLGYLVFQAPSYWVALGLTGRLLQVLTGALELVMIAYLHTPRLRRLLAN
jgi:hypothetical protein